MSALRASAARARHDVADASPGSKDKGKARYDPSTDEEYALLVFAEETRAWQERMEASALGLYTDEPEELLDANDGEYGWAYGYSHPSSSGGGSSHTFEANTHNWMGSHQHCYCEDCTRSHKPRTYASSSAYKLPEAQSVRDVSCVACMDRIEGPVIRAPCGHDYDVDCVVGLFRAATTDESLFPPACCRQPFDFQRLRPYMDGELARLFEKKAREFSTQNRVYCSRASCSAFLGSGTNSATAISCSACGTQTCGHCKKAAHSATQRCTNDADKEILSMATKEGWKQCPRCGLVVELSYGCNHMTCRCNYQFCYVCLARWKTCVCSQWDLLRLMEAEDDPELLEEAIRNLDAEWPPRPGPVDPHAPLFGPRANLPARPFTPRRRATDAQVRVRPPTPERRRTWAPARPPTPRFGPGDLPDGRAEASGAGPNWTPPEPAAPDIPVVAPPSWGIYGGPLPYYWPLNHFAPIAFPQRVFCQQHLWVPTAPLVPGSIIRGCANCNIWQSGLWRHSRTMPTYALNYFLPEQLNSVYYVPD
ncbi:hypothetical protein C8T65DRAFT_691445 [Cerioporus squamosus]|nr:hypothetical protein C8T65DRAFT_691445 [Cerioporus squamosus]